MGITSSKQAEQLLSGGGSDGNLLTDVTETKASLYTKKRHCENPYCDDVIHAETSENTTGNPLHSQKFEDFLRMEELCEPSSGEVEDDRPERLQSCRILDTPPETRFDKITTLLADMFRVPVSIMTLLDSDRCWFKSWYGPMSGGVAGCDAWCNYINLPTEPEILIVENAPRDSRFCRNPYAVGPPFIKFYAGAPLVGTGGRRYGTICVIDLVPRTFTAELYHMLINFAELAVQELEQNSEMLEAWSRQAVSDVRKNRRLRASISSATDGVALIDTRSPDWSFKFFNDAFVAASGAPEEKLRDQSFFQAFQPVGMTVSELAAFPAAGKSVSGDFVAMADGQRIELELRPASSDQLTPGKAVGVPSWVPSENDPAGTEMGVDAAPTDVAARDRGLCADVERCFYFAIVTRAPPSASRGGSAVQASANGSAGSSASSRIAAWRGRESGGAAPSSSGTASSGSAYDSVWRDKGSPLTYGDFHLPLELIGLSIGPLIGSGAFGKVYRGTWEGGKVAVKVLSLSTEESVTAAENEAALGMSAAHPCVVKTIKCVLTGEQSHLLKKGLETREMKEHVMWLLQEFCDRGTLIDAASRGWLRTAREPDAAPDMHAICTTLSEVASGMAHLHDANIVHCDLNGRNVMLARSDADSRGFSAKVCDFGLARICEGDNIDPGKFGTLSHMSPEWLLEERVTFKADVWAFGVLMWELYTGARAFHGKKEGFIIFKITTEHPPLQLEDGAPEFYTDLMRMCMARNAEDRPSFHDIGRMLAQHL